VTAPLPRSLWILGATALAFLTVPLVAVGIRVPWQDLPSLLSTAAALDALQLSLITCLASTAISFVLGVPLALLISRLATTPATILRTMVTLPMVLPPVVAGLALLMALGRRGVLGATFERWGIEIGFTTAAVVIAQSFVAMPFLVVAVEGALRSTGVRHEVVAATLGSSPLSTLFRVTLPRMAPALASGAALCFARALGEFGATLTFAGSLQGVTRTMPLEIYLQRESDTASALALSVVLIMVAIIILAATGWLTRRSDRGRHAH